MFQNNYKKYVFVKYYVQIRNREKIEKDMEDTYRLLVFITWGNGLGVRCAI